jgi:hypothetical protein
LRNFVVAPTQSQTYLSFSKQSNACVLKPSNAAKFGGQALKKAQKIPSSPSKGSFSTLRPLDGIAPPNPNLGAQKNLLRR